jgi:hypothetical protein
MSTRIALLVVAAVAAAAYVAIEERSAERPTAAEASALRALVLAAATAYGDPTPDGGTVAFGPHGEVIGHSGSVRRPGREVFVVRLAGNFVNRFRVEPGGRAATRGRLLELVYDAATLEMEGVGIGRDPQLSPFGRTRRLIP